MIATVSPKDQLRPSKQVKLIAGQIGRTCAAVHVVVPDAIIKAEQPYNHVLDCLHRLASLQAATTAEVRRRKRPAATETNELSRTFPAPAKNRAPVHRG